MKTEDCLIDLKGLKNGAHQFFYDLDDEFFGSFESQDILSGAVKASIEVQKTAQQFQFSVTVEGRVVTTCDRCLDPLEVEIENEEEFGVRFGAETNMDDEDLIVLAEEEAGFNLAERLYEMTLVALPLVKVHPEGQCNAEMIAVLNAHNAENQKSETSGDPRWDALKKLSSK